MTTRQIVLDRYRTELSQAPSRHVSVQTAPVRDLADGQVRVRNTHLAPAAVEADLMAPDPGLPMPGFTVGEPLVGRAVGVVLESRAEGVDVGAVVQHMQGYREESVLSGGEFFPVPAEPFPGPDFVLNQGVTAYHGMVDVAEVRDGDVVWVTGAAGGVGSLAGQIASGAARRP